MLDVVVIDGVKSDIRKWVSHNGLINSFIICKVILNIDFAGLVYFIPSYHQFANT